MKILPSELLNKWKSDPMKYDSEVRSYCNLRSDRYYSVITWPENVAGRVFESNLSRTVTNKKISKSDQT